MARAALQRRIEKLEERSDPRRRGGVLHIPADASPEQFAEFTAFFVRQCALEGVDADAFVLVPETCQPEYWNSVVAQQRQYAWQHPFLSMPGGDHGAI